jgi:hypothetical protein
VISGFVRAAWLQWLSVLALLGLLLAGLVLFTPLG